MITKTLTLNAVFLLKLIFSSSHVKGHEDVFNCSKYKFIYNKNLTKNWTNSFEECRKDNGRLVCIGARNEWEFIVKTIQTLNVTNTEWNIGLKYEGGEWKWIDGKLLIWNNIIGDWPWHKGEPYGIKERNAVYVKMWGNMGLYDNVHGYKRLSYICEYSNVNSEECKLQTTSSALKTTETQYTTNTQMTTHASTLKTTQRRIKTTSTNVGSDDLNSKMRTTSTTSTLTKTTPWTTIGHHRYTGTNSTSHTTQGYQDASTQGHNQPQNDCPTTYLVVALSVLLFLYVCTLVAGVYYCKKKKKAPTDLKDDEIKMTPHYINVRADSKPVPAQPTNDPTLSTGTYKNVSPQKAKPSSVGEKRIVDSAVLELKKTSQQGLKMNETKEGVYETID